jgi:hypothetical protein
VYYCLVQFRLNLAGDEAAQEQASAMRELVGDFVGVIVTLNAYRINLLGIKPL